MENLSNGNIRLMKNFTQTELWNRIKQRFGKKFVIPLFFYYDDFDIDNPLGPHRGLKKLVEYIIRFLVCLRNT